MNILLLLLGCSCVTDQTMVVGVFLLSVAGGDLDVPHALLALDIAAPVELALAALLDGRLVRVVAPAAAHQIAAVHAGRSPVARPTVRP